MEENTTEEPVAQAEPQPEEAQPAPDAEPRQDEADAPEKVEASNDIDSDTDEAEDNELPEEPWVTDTELPASYNWAWREVIKGLMDRKPAYQAYAEAYDIDITEKDGKNERTCRANASRLLTNDNFKRVWRKVLTEVGFNNETVDNELVKLITDPSVHHAVKRAAIRDFNELHGRIISRIDHTSDGKGFFAKSKLEVEVVEDPKTEDQPDTEHSASAS